MPPVPTPYERIDLRTSPEIKQLIVRASAAAGVTVSAFLIGAAQERARQVLAERESVSLSPRDWEVFFQSLDETEKPRPSLQAVMDRYSAWQAGQENE